MTVDMSLENTLNALEKRADDYFLQLSIWDLPIRTILTNLYVIIDRLIYGSRVTPNESPKRESVLNLICRLSYLCSTLLKCKTEPIGHDAYDAGLLIGNKKDEIEFLISYLHLCELMPEVHRGFYVISLKNDDKEIILSYKDNSYMEYEELDIILNNISTGMTITPPEINIPFFICQINSLLLENKLLFSGLKILTKYFDWYLCNTLEQIVFTNDALKKSFGVSIDCFKRFQAAWFSIAQFHLDLISTMSIPLKANQSDKLARELLNWVAPLWKISFIKKLVMHLADLKGDQYDKLMQLFALSRDCNNAGDGFFPPFIQLNSGIMFQPEIVKSMLHFRNIPYVMNKCWQNDYNNTLSPTMEPKLIFMACEILSRLQDTIIKRNISWDDGEIDLLLYRNSENVAVHVQAKGSIPPQGARMVSNLEVRINEGINQLNKFQQLTQEQKDKIISNAIQQEVNNVKVIDAMLVWSSYGTYEIWQKLEKIAPLNLAILYHLVTESPKFKLGSLVEETYNLFSKLKQSIKPNWSEQSINVMGHHIRFPVLIFDESKLIKYRKYLRCLEFNL